MDEEARVEVTAAGMKPGVYAAAAMLRTLANPQRLRILCLLAEGERTVSELTQATGVRQAAASQQLQRLRAESMVSARREGRHVYYSLSDPAVLAIIRTLSRIFCEYHARD